MTRSGEQPKAIGLLEYVLYVAVIVPAVFGLRYVDRLGCPADAFICGTDMKSWLGVLRIALVAAALVYPVKALLYAATRNRWLRPKFDGYYDRFDLRATMLRAAAVMVLVVPTILLLSNGRVWASAAVIDEREYVWSMPINHSWDDVVAVSTWCQPGSRGAWNEGYDLTFRDHSDVDLGVNLGPIADHKAAVLAALHGRRVDFDDSAVDKDCPAPFRDMATTRP